MSEQEQQLSADLLNPTNGVPANDTNQVGVDDTSNSTLKSTSISQSTSFSSIKSDDDYQSTTSEQPSQKQADKQGSVEVADEQKKLKQDPLPQRINITLNLNSTAKFDAKTTPQPTVKQSVRYSKEFLEKIRKERSKFIEQIYPDIFKAYCYCMNGKYWNPEKYYDVVQHQFPDELDKIKRFNKKSQNQQQGRPNSGTYQQPQQQQQGKSQQQFSHGTKKHYKSVNDSQTSNGQKKQHTSPNQQQQQRSNAGKVILALIKPRNAAEQQSQPQPQSQQQQQTAPTSILAKLLAAPKTPTKDVDVQSARCSMLPPLFNAPPPAPPSTPSTNLLDLLNNKNAYIEQQNTNAYKKLLTYMNRDQEQREQQQNGGKNENIIKKLFDQKAATKFPTVNPHELPFQTIDYALNQILKSTSSSSSASVSSSAPSSSTTSPQKMLDNLMEKLKVGPQSPQQQHQHQAASGNDHFNSLLNKIASNKQSQSQSHQTDILKWFTQPQQPQLAMKLQPDNAHVFTLKDIESAF